MNSTTIDSNLAKYVLSHSIRFWILLIFTIPSIICSLFLLYLLFNDRTLRQALNNHVIINLGSQLLDNSLYLNYLRINFVWPSSPIMCIIWIIVGYQFYVASTLLVALASIQRHIIIFHRKLFYYFPMIILLLYSIAYGCVIISLITIDGYTYDYTTVMCGRLETWIKIYHHLLSFLVSH